jgi:cytidylate kinase
MAFRLLTVEREYGCGGGEIARKLSERLGWTLWDQRLTSEIARLSNCEQHEVRRREERVDPLYYRLLKSVMRGSFEGSLNAPQLQLLDADTIVRLTERLVDNIAATGNCVIVGRGSQHFLRNRPDTLRVFLYAPRAAKIDRLRQTGVGESEVEHLVDSVDSERAAFVEKYFHIEWPDRPVYHAMFNTAFGDEAVIGEVLSLKASLERAGDPTRSAQPADSSRATGI